MFVFRYAIVEAIAVGGENALAAAAVAGPLPRFEPAACCVRVIGAGVVGIAFVVQQTPVRVVIPRGCGSAGVAGKALPGFHGFHATGVIVGVLHWISARAIGLLQET